MYANIFASTMNYIGIFKLNLSWIALIYILFVESQELNLFYLKLYQYPPKI